MTRVERPTPTTARPGYLIKRAQAALHAELGHALHEFGVTLSQFAILTALAEEPGLSNAELARRAFITPQSMSEVLRELEQRGWVVRSPHPAHGRILQSRLTDQGHGVLRECDQAASVIEERMLSGLGPGRRRELSEALRACVDALASAE